MQKVTASGSWCAALSVFRHVRSTPAKRFPSVGSWRMMSSEEKIGSRYIQERWQVGVAAVGVLSHSSKMSDISTNSFSHSSIRWANGPLNGLNDIDWVITMWSSSSCWISSKPLST